MFRADVMTGNMVGPIAEVRDASWLSLSTDGRKLFLVGAELNSMVILDLDAHGSFRFVPVQTLATSVWADPEGAYVYVGSSNLQRIDLD